MNVNYRDLELRVTAMMNPDRNEEDRAFKLMAIELEEQYLAKMAKRLKGLGHGQDLF